MKTLLHAENANCSQDAPLGTGGPQNQWPPRLFFSAFALLVSGAVACGENEEAHAACVPGSSVECACSDGRQGAQICSKNERYGVCKCTGEEPEAATDEREEDDPSEDVASDDDPPEDVAADDDTSIGAGDASTDPSVRDDERPEAPEPLTEIAGLVAGATGTCFWLTSGEVLCTGVNGNLYPVQELAGPVAQVSTPGALDKSLEPHACAVLESGGVQCWGDNSRGQLGDGSQTNSSYAIDVEGVAEAVEVQTTARSSCARTRDGGIRCWGHYFDGATTVVSSGAIGFTLGYYYIPPSLGNGEKNYLYMFVLLQNGDVSYLVDDYEFESKVSFPSPVVQITPVFAGICAVLESHEVYCATNAKEFSGPDEPRKVVGLPEATQVASNTGDWLENYSGSACALGVDGRVYCWLSNEYGQLGLGFASQEPVGSLDVQAVEGIDDAVFVSVGEGYACALLEDHTAKCWGRNDQGQLADPTLNDRLSPVVVMR